VASTFVVLSVVVLTGFHLALLRDRLLDASIAQPGVVARWLASAVLVVALIRARRSLRHFAVLWLLVALLHAGMAMTSQRTGTARDLAVVVEIGLTAACGLLLTALIAGASDAPADSQLLAVIEASLTPSVVFHLQPGRSPPAA
jgi:hypothetical protein